MALRHLRACVVLAAWACLAGAAFGREPEAMSLEDKLLRRIFEDGSRREVESYATGDKRTAAAVAAAQTPEQVVGLLAGPADVRARRLAPLLMLRHPPGAADAALKARVDDAEEDDFVRLNAALALAYRGDKAGAAVLRLAAGDGHFADSNSGFERDRAALGLLILREQPPAEYLRAADRDPLFQEVARARLGR